MDSSRGTSPPPSPPPQPRNPPCPLNCSSPRHNPANVYYLIQGMLSLPPPPTTATATSSPPTHRPQRSAVVMVGGDGEARTREFQATGTAPPLVLDDALRLVLTNMMESDRVVFHVDCKNEIPVEDHNKKTVDVFSRILQYNQKFDDIMDPIFFLTNKEYSLAEPFVFNGGDDDPALEGEEEEKPVVLPSLYYGIMMRKLSPATMAEERFVQHAIAMIGITPKGNSCMDDRPPLGQILNAFAESLDRPESVAFREEDEGMKDKIKELVKAYAQIGKVCIAMVLADRLKTMRGSGGD